MVYEALDDLFCTMDTYKAPKYVMEFMVQAANTQESLLRALRSAAQGLHDLGNGLQADNISNLIAKIEEGREI